MTSPKFITLQATHDKLPFIAYNTASIRAYETEEAVYNAIKTGYRLIVGAHTNGNEAEVGKGVKRAIADGIVKREELFIVGKLWNNFREKQYVKPYLQITLDNYGLDYIDLYLVHFHFALEYADPTNWFKLTCNLNRKELKTISVPLEETWRELETLVDAGLIRNLGVSHFSFHSLVELLRCTRIPPSVLEVEHHPYHQQKRLIEWARSKGIQVMGYNPYADVNLQVKPPGADDLDPVTLRTDTHAIRDKHGINNATQVILAWAMGQGVVALPDAVVGVYGMKDHLDVVNINLDDNDVQVISKMDANIRFSNYYIGTDKFNLPFFD
ncbi:hypothetical protein MBANPS3_006135 [Mucor bainieri]